MNKSASHSQLAPRQISKSPSRRAIYFNQETKRKEVSTIFHSPYKDGKKNPNYFNPSFVSSHLLYPKQHFQPQKKQIVVTKNCIPNVNDVKKDALYRQRLSTQKLSRSKTKEKEQKNQRQFNKQRETKVMRIFRANQPQALLKNELGNLHNYRQNYQQKQERYKDLSRRIPQPQIPAYLQNPLKREKSSTRKNNEQTERVYLAEYNLVKRELKDLKRQLKSNNVDEENIYMDQIIMQNRQLQRQEYNQQRKQSELLGNILRQQIKTNELLKDKRWRF